MQTDRNMKQGPIKHNVKVTILRPWTCLINSTTYQTNSENNYYHTIAAGPIGIPNPYRSIRGGIAYIPPAENLKKKGHYLINATLIIQRTDIQ